MVIGDRVVLVKVRRYWIVLVVERVVVIVWRDANPQNPATPENTGERVVWVAPESVAVNNITDNSVTAGYAWNTLVRARQNAIACVSIYGVVKDKCLK
jgi:hypothetical protein